MINFNFLLNNLSYFSSEDLVGRPMDSTCLRSAPVPPSFRLRLHPLRMVATLLLILCLGVGNAWGTSYIAYEDDTQKASTTISSSNVSSGSAGNISWSGSSCGYSNSRVNISANGYITFSVSSGNVITKIVMTTVTSDDYYGTWTSTAGSVSGSGTATVTITGINASSVKVTTSTAYRCTSSGSIKIYYTASGPTITTSSSMTTFGCNMTTGVPVKQSFTVSGTALTNNVTVTPPSGYEVCLTENGTYTSSVELSKGSGTLSSTTVYVKLKDDNAAGSYSGNIACTSSGATTKNVAVSGSTPFKVTWKANGSTYATTYVAYATSPGTALGSLPDDPDPDDYCGDAFYGWYDGDSYKNAAVAPSIISTSTKIISDKTYKAVFADISGSSTTWVLTSLSSVTAGTYALMTGDYHAFNGSISSSKGGITTNAFSFTDGVATSAPTGTCEITFIAVTGGFKLYNSSTSKYLYAKGNTSGNLAWNDSESSYWKYNSSNWVYNSNSARLRSYNNGNFNTYNSNVDNSYAITLAKKTSVNTYSNYTTTCCTPLGTINGSVSWTNPTQAVLTWNAMSNVDATTPYTITYRTGSDDFDDDNVGSITTNGAGKKTCTITGLNCNTSYDFKIEVAADDGYCDKDTTMTGKNSGKWTITRSGSPAGTVTGGTFTTGASSSCSGSSISISATASDGYAFSSWTIDKAGGGTVSPAVSSASTSFTMPADNVTVTAAFSCVPPTFSAHPASKTDYLTTDSPTALGFTASAAGGDLTQQWQISSDNSSWSDIDGETDETYTPTISTAGTKYYRVVVSNDECDASSATSNVATITSVAPSVCKTPTFSVSAGTYSSAQSVELSCGTDGATIRYTTNGDDPTESSSVYSSAISVSVNTTIKAKAFKADMTPSTIASATYNIRCAAPTFSLDEAIYVGSQSLTMSSATDGATVRYTTDESTPTGSSTAYSSALTVGTSTTYKAKAYKDGMTESEESEVYIMIQCAEPTFNVSAGTYNANQSVSISTTYGTTIYYTLDGKDPTTKSSTYSSAITIDATKTLKAIAVKDGCEDSDVASATYTLKCATPTFSPAAGTYTGAQSVSMSCATTGSAIHYTTNGTDPTGSSTTYSSAISVGTNQTVKAIATKTGWSDSEVASAAYTIKYNVAVASVDNVTISATTPSVAEGSSAAAAYGSTVSLSYSGVASGKTWGGWNVYKTDDASTTVTVTSNQFTMPAYNVTVSAIIYGDAIAWCDPDVEVTGDVHLTSTKDVPVRYSPIGSDNLITISSSDMGSATTMEVAYLNADAADVEVDKDDSPFRFYKADGSATTEAIDLDYEWNTSHPISYTPSAYGVTNNYKLQLTFKRGDKVLKTIKKAIYGRGLPEEFVIAVKKGNQWVALPSNLASTSAQPSIIPQVITVNDIETPTAATYAPTTTVYKAMSSGNAAHISTLRFTTTGSNYLQVSGSDYYNMWLSTTNSANVQDWQLKSSDFNSYELTIPSNNATKKMGIYSSTYMGYHGSPNNANIYLLPITNKYSEIAATVSEWGEHGVVVQPSSPAALSGVASATMNIGTEDPTAATTLAVNAVMGTAKRVKVDDVGGDLDVGVIANEGKSLYIHWKNSGGSEIGISQVTIPTVIAASNDMYSIANTKAAWAAKSEVYVLPGVTLDANAGSFTGDGALSVSNLHLYPGATLNVSTGTFNATTLRLHNGWTRAGEKAYDVARVYIADNAALTKTTATMDYDIYELADGQHFYPLAVPFPVAVSAIDYADSWLAGYSSYGMDGQYVIKEYNGARRAEKGPDQANNWTPLAEDATLSPGKGYIMAAVPVYGEAIIRIPLTFDNGWTSDGEKASYDDDTKNVVAVTAYSGAATAGDKKVNKGWNLLGVPFMSCYGTGADMGTDGVVMQGKFNFDDGNWKEDGVRYVNVPLHDFSEYIQVDMEDDDPVTVLRPGWCFFVQVEEDGDLTFLPADQAASSSLPIYAPKRGVKADMPTLKTGIILSDGEKSDKTTFLISDKYNGAEYEINADLEKMFGNGYTLATYSLSGATRLAYNALSNADAANIIPIGYRAPVDGEYTFAINPKYAENGAFEQVNLIDYETGSVTDLLQYSYTFSTGRTQNDSRFAINVVKQKETPTGIENIQGDNVQGTNVRKLLIDGKVYIIRSGQMYDATGKKVKGGAQ